MIEFLFVGKNVKMRPIYFKGSDSVYSNFFRHPLHVPELNQTFFSLEQAYQYLCAVKNGYSKVSQDILQVPDGPNCGKVCKRLSRQIVNKTHNWYAENLDIMYSLLQHKFEQCIPFQRALLCSDQKLLHTVSSRFWGVADGSGTNEFGKF